MAENTVKLMIKAGKQIKGATVAVFGVTFKENCADVRNTKVVDVIRELEEYGIKVKVADPVADEEDLWRTYRIKLCSIGEINGADAVVFAVSHNEFRNMKLKDIRNLYNQKWKGCPQTMNEVATATEEVCNRKYVLVDVKGMFNRKEAESMGFLYWRL